MQFIRSHRKYLGYALIILGLVAFTAVKAPDMHKNYIATNVGTRVISLRNPKNRGNGGTGFVLKTKSGHNVTITNAHICRLAHNGSLDAVMPNSSRVVSLKVLEVSATSDLCAVESPPVIEGLTLANSLSKYQTIGVVGHPKLQPTTLSLGQITTLHEVITVMIGMQVTEEACNAMGGDKFYNIMGLLTVCVKNLPAARTNVVVYGGNSGSPVVNIYGNVVGVLFASDSDTNWGFIVPLKLLTEFLEIY